jgi:hypothetical protein
LGFRIGPVVTEVSFFFFLWILAKHLSCISRLRRF